MIVVGLTGSIGMGKSTAATYLRFLGIPVHDADAAVHSLYAAGGAAVAPVANAFPAAIVDDAVSRAALSRVLAADPGRLRQLEAIVHPLARREQYRFLTAMAMRREPVVVLEIPLLFETGSDVRCDAVIVVSSPSYLQRQRVLSRAGMDEKKLALLLSRQMPDREKRRRATFVIPSNRGKRDMLEALRRVLHGLRVRNRSACVRRSGRRR